MALLKKIAAFGFAGLLLLVFVAATAIFGLSEMRLHQGYDVPLVPLRIAPSPEMAAEGKRLAEAVGCLGCHKQAGNVLFAAENVGSLVAPNLTAKIPSYSDAELLRLLRHGVKRDGTSTISMPALALTHLADDDIARIVAYLRSLPARPDAVGTTQWGPLGRVAVVAGKVAFSADLVHPANDPPRHRPDGPPAELGRYIVASVCTSCHKLDVDNDDGWVVKAPALRPMVASYDFADFERLMRTGIAAGGREVGLMSEIARGDLTHLTDAEIEGVYAYLHPQQETD
jgi:mono/diheme cytochrome c family protein